MLVDDSKAEMSEERVRNNLRAVCLVRAIAKGLFEKWFGDGRLMDVVVVDEKESIELSGGGCVREGCKKEEKVGGWVGEGYL
jgi:hypothetical protein